MTRRWHNRQDLCHAIEQLVDYEELKAENERLKKQLVKQA